MFNQQKFMSQLEEFINNYLNDINKPAINHVILTGDLSLDELDIQQKLIAGDNIVITDNVISAIGGWFGWEVIEDVQLAYDNPTGELRITIITNEATWTDAVIIPNTGGDDASLTRDVTAQLTVGGIKQWDVLPQGTKFTDFVVDLLSAYNTPQAQLAVTPTTVELGQLIQATFTAKTTFPENAASMRLTLSDGTTSIWYSNLGEEKVVTRIISGLTTPGTTFTGTNVVTDTKGSTTTAIATIAVYPRLYWGCSYAEDIDSPSNLFKGGNVVAASIKGSRYFGWAEGDGSTYKYVFSTEELDPLNGFKDSSTGFVIPFTYLGTTTINNQYWVNVTYNMYRSSYGLGSDMIIDIL